MKIKIKKVKINIFKKLKGWLNHHHWPEGGFNHAILAGLGWPKPPVAIGGGPATPKSQTKYIYIIH